MTLKDAVDIWEDKKETHLLINNVFTKHVNADPELKAYRDWIEKNIFGFGERSFLWMWKLLVDEMPKTFKFLEIGVFRGQILGLIEILSTRTNKVAIISGVTPLDSTGDHWESDYAADIKLLHDTFNLTYPTIIKGLSTQPSIIATAKLISPYDIIYIDGGHSYEVTKSDSINYPPMVKIGGYLVIDDCANKYDLPNGYFRGIESVSKAVDELFPNQQFIEVFSVVHNRVFQRIS